VETVVHGEQGRRSGQAPAPSGGPEHNDEFGAADVAAVAEDRAGVVLPRSGSAGVEYEVALRQAARRQACSLSLHGAPGADPLLQGRHMRGLASMRA